MDDEQLSLVGLHPPFCACMLHRVARMTTFMLNRPLWYRNVTEEVAEALDVPLTTVYMAVVDRGGGNVLTWR